MEKAPTSNDMVQFHVTLLRVQFPITTVTVLASEAVLDLPIRLTNVKGFCQIQGASGSGIRLVFPPPAGGLGG